MFINWSTDPSWGAVGAESIPASQFEVSESPTSTAITCIVATVLAAIGVGLMISQYPGTDMFWLGTGETLLGVSLFIGALIHKHYDHGFQRDRMLHHCKTAEEYRDLLKTDKGVDYSFKIENYLAKFNSSSTADLNKQAQKDAHRSIYCVDKTVIQPQELVACFGDKARYANQAVVADLAALLNSRYTCQESNITVIQRPIEKPNEQNTRYNLTNEGTVLEIEQLFGLVDNGEVTKFFRAKASIDFKTNDAVFTWSSPLDERPSF